MICIANSFLDMFQYYQNQTMCRALPDIEEGMSERWVVHNSYRPICDVALPENADVANLAEGLIWVNPFHRLHIDCCYEDLCLPLTLTSISMCYLERET